jgi:hypothetical protein
MYKTPRQGMEEGRNFPNLAVFASHQVGRRIFYRVNNLVNILWGFLWAFKSPCKMSTSAVFAALARVLKTL